MHDVDLLKASSYALRVHDEQRQEMVHTRDEVLARLRAKGASWSDLQRWSGLSARSVALSLRRIEAIN